ncbi:hypothetical protein [Halalkalibacter urbisdiaboli]|uniref:hypothetical protein n=1 Tax=Halalkalibacter urbisdiaboli TaxID=1960589 RepID=UPI000B4402F0|nr:hypothetical protein [Halalkalibacter urbisdiaboli]
MIEFYLALDEPRPHDTEVLIDKILFIYDLKAYDEIGGYLKIDFNPSQGLKMINSNQTLAYGLRLKK